MWPLFYALGSNFSRLLVLPVAAIIGTAGYYAEKKLFPKQKSIDYLSHSVQEQREKRQAAEKKSNNEPFKLPDSLGLLKPTKDD